MLMKTIIPENYIEEYDCRYPYPRWKIIPLEDPVPEGWIVETRSICDEICAIREKWLEIYEIEEEEKSKKKKEKALKKMEGEKK